MTGLVVRTQLEASEFGSVATVLIDGLPRSEPNKIIYEIDGPDAPKCASSGNFAIAAALPTAMSRGLPLHYAGEADGEFLSAMEEYMAAWCRWRPDLFQQVTLSADVETSPRLPETQAAIMAFSGGLDSTFALHAHKHHLLGRRSLNVEAAVLIQGFDIPWDDDQAFKIARGHIANLTESYGVRLNTVKTNWQKPFCIKWGMTHILGIGAILHLFDRQFGHAIFADDTPYDHQLTPWSSNAITNQMLGHTRFRVRSAGASWDRTEKAKAVASNPAILNHLRVCYERPELGENCGECEKCIRTKLNFYAAGVRYVPALKSAVTAEQVRAKCRLNPRIVHLYVDTLEQGCWDAQDPIRREVEALVKRYRRAGDSGVVAVANPSKPTRFRVARRKLKSIARATLATVKARF